MNRRNFLRTLTTVTISMLIASMTRLLPKRATQLSTLGNVDEMTCIIDDRTGELGALCERIAAEFSSCRTIYVANRWLDVILYIEVWVDKYDRLLACTLRDTIKNLADEHRFLAIIDGLRHGIEYWESIGPPYRTEVTETSYKAYYTPEQRRRMNEPIETQ